MKIMKAQSHGGEDSSICWGYIFKSPLILFLAKLSMLMMGYAPPCCNKNLMSMVIVLLLLPLHQFACLLSLLHVMLLLLLWLCWLCVILVAFYESHAAASSSYCFPNE
jgi:hypothetical protein